MRTKEIHDAEANVTYTKDADSKREDNLTVSDHLVFHSQD